MNEQQITKKFTPTLLNLIRPIINEQFKNDDTLKLFVTTAITCAVTRSTTTMTKKRKTPATNTETKATVSEPPLKKTRKPVPDEYRCLAITKTGGKQCSNRRMERDTLCSVHWKKTTTAKDDTRIKKKTIPTTLSDLDLGFSDDDDLFIVG